MKIIHTSDIHLNSKMETKLNSEQAKERKQELLSTFLGLVNYATSHNVSAIIIAGDLFDTESINKKTADYVINTITSSPQINFYYLCGNHEKQSFLNYIETVPENLKTFNERWIAYKEGSITISGIDITKENTKSLYGTLQLDSNDFNIVVMHGQISSSFVRDNYEIVNLNEIKNKNIDYLALGHLHSHSTGKIDDRGVYCYSGCLEGRGFDETNEKGFVELNIENGKYTKTFIPFAKRTLYEIEVDISSVNTLKQIEDLIRKSLNFSKDSLVRIVLKGTINENLSIDTSLLEEMLRGMYYFLTIRDNTTLKINIDSYKNDVSIKGEFVNSVLNSELNDKQKEQIILCGLHFLNGGVNK